MRWQKLVVGLACGALGGGALAQSTVGDLRTAKATRLSQAQVTELVTDASLRGPTSSGGSMEIKYKGNGTFAGTVQLSTFGSDRGTSSGSFGKWSVDKNGWLCAEGETSKGAKPFKTCSFLYRLNEKLYAAHGSKPETPVFEQTVHH